MRTRLSSEVDLTEVVCRGSSVKGPHEWTLRAEI